MIIEIEKLLKAKEIELNIVQEQYKALTTAMKEAQDTFKTTDNFWSVHNALAKWQEVARSEYKELNSMLEKAKDIQAKIDQLTK